MKIVVFGTSEFAVPVLEAVADRHDVVGVVTQPDRPAGRGHKLVATPVKEAALARGLPVFTPERLVPFATEARALGADAFVVASYGKIVPQALLDVVPIAFNVHPSLLPLYRGATPLQTAIRDGRTETGVTIIAMDAGMDTGDILVQERTPLGASETYGELHDRLALRGAALAAEALERYERGALSRTPQNASGVPEAEIAATLTRPLRKHDLIVDWNQPRERAIDLVRSLAPQPLARADYPPGQTLKIASMRAVGEDELREVAGADAQSAPGPAIATGKHPLFWARCGDGQAVAIERLIAPNRGPMRGDAFARSEADRTERRQAAP